MQVFKSRSNATFKLSKKKKRIFYKTDWDMLILHFRDKHHGFFEYPNEYSSNDMLAMLSFIQDNNQRLCRKKM